MERSTLDQLESAFDAVRSDLSGRVAQLAGKSSAGALSEDERVEYERIGDLRIAGLFVRGSVTQAVRGM